VNIIEREIVFAGSELILNNQRVLFWKEKALLVLSDLHLGKASHFRKNGIALPTEIATKDLQRLEKLIAYYNAKKILIVGDLIHAGNNKEVSDFKNFTTRFDDVDFILIKGNHDRISEKKLQEIGIPYVYDSLRIEHITFSHQSNPESNIFEITGHTHPGVRLKMPTRGYIKLPCFVVTDKSLILPAFSHFTGLNTSSFSEKAVYYAFSDDGIFKI